MINQLRGEYQCLNKNFIRYFTITKCLLEKFPYHDLIHIKICHNVDSNVVAQMMSRCRITKALANVISYEVKMLSPIEDWNMAFEINTTDIQEDWRKPYIEYLTNPVS